MQKLIADSGSTKTDWALVSDGGLVSKYTTQGLSPVHQSQADMRSVLTTELLPQLNAQCADSVYFYGSGVRPELESVVETVIRDVFPCAQVVEARSDMLGAARALLKHNYGIANILGTGANSCLYDGERIIQQTPSLGYILGDDGSGASIGRHFLRDMYRGVLSEEIRIDFERSSGLSLADVIRRVYREPMGNRFLASHCEYIHSKMDNPQVAEIVHSEFLTFFRDRVLPYNRPDLPVSFVGSIAYYFRPQLEAVAKELGLRLGMVLRQPIDALY